MNECESIYCPFCLNSRLKNNKLVNLPTTESILFQNNNVYVQVDIAPLTRGHILIVTNNHYTNFNQVPNNMKNEVKQLQNKIKKIYKELYNMDTLFFEHGSIATINVGSCIEHAHIHCLPCDFSIKKTVDKLLGIPEENNILDENSKIDKEKPYIFIQSGDNQNYLYLVSKLPSQFLRKIVADTIKSSEHRWQELSATKNNKEIFNQTILDLKNKI